MTDVEVKVVAGIVREVAQQLAQTQQALQLMQRQNLQLQQSFSGMNGKAQQQELGNLFATGPGGVHVFMPDGTHLGTIDTGVPTANCAFGDDGTTLYVACDKSLCRIKLSTKGRGF